MKDPIDLEAIESFIDGYKGIAYQAGHIYFHDFDIYQDMISQIADYLKSVEVTEETLQENKKLVARVRKATEALEQTRIHLKKGYLEPYTEFEQKVKYLVNMAREAEDTVRDQLRDFDIRRMEEKQKEIEELFEKRKRPYDFPGNLTVDRFMKQKYLNKTCSMNTIEHEMVEFFEDIKSSLEAISEVYSNIDERAKVIAHYMQCLSLTQALKNYAEQEREEAKAKAFVQEPKKTEPPKVSADMPETEYDVFYIEKGAPSLKTEMFLLNNKIKFRKGSDK